MSEQGQDGMTQRAMPEARSQSLPAPGEGRYAYRLLEALRAGQPTGLARRLLVSQLEELVGSLDGGGSSHSSARLVGASHKVRCVARHVSPAGLNRLSEAGALGLHRPGQTR